MSQSKAAAAAGVPVATLRNWERGRREPLFLAVVALAAALGCSVADFAPDDDPPPQKARGKPQTARLAPVSVETEDRKGEWVDRRLLD